MTLGERIKAKRKGDRISAEDLAVKLGLKKENIYKWERGSKPSDPEDFLKINMWLAGVERESVPHETGTNSNSTDHAKYVALLESTNRTLEKSIQLSLNALLEGQRMIKAMLKTSVQNGEDLLAGGNKKELDKVKEETNKRNAANYRAMMQTDTTAGIPGMG